MKELLLITLLIVNTSLFAQKYFTKTGNIKFSASSPLEEIKAKNNTVGCLFDAQTGALDYIVQIKSFVFTTQLMQEHFNENYMESDKFPKATFKGKILNGDKINVGKDGQTNVDVEGILTMHGISKNIKTKGTLAVKGKQVLLNAEFSALLSDYKIEIPSAVKDKISKSAIITVSSTLDALAPKK